MKLVDLVKWVVIISCLLLIMMLISIFGYVKFKHSITEKRTYEHLFEYGYEDKDIISIKSKYKFGTRYTSEVKFRDEPGIIYEYVIRDKKAKQLGPEFYDEDYDYKHLE